MTKPVAPQAAFIIHTAQQWDEAAGEIKAPSEGPPSLKSLNGYALHSGFAGELDLARVPERVLIVCDVVSARELGMAGNDTSATGVYQQLPSGHLAVLLPWCTFSPRRKRSEMWRRYFIHQVELAQKVAREPKLANSFQWGEQVWGDGPEVVNALLRILRSPTPVAVDVETVGEMPDMVITAIGFATDEVAVSVPWSGYISKAFGIQPGCQNPRVQDLVAKVLASEAHVKVFHNGAFDRAVFASLGMPCNGPWEDTILMMKILFNELYRNLQFSAGMSGMIPAWKDEFKNERKALLEGHAKSEANRLLDAAHHAANVTRRKAGQKPIKKKKAKVSLSDWHEIPLEALLKYNCRDSTATIRLWRFLTPRLEAFYRGPEKYTKLLALAEMGAEQWLFGFEIDVTLRNKMIKDGRSNVAKLIREWRKLVGPNLPPYGPGSTKKLHKLFFETCRAPVVARGMKDGKKGKGDPSLNTFSLIQWEASGRQPLSDAAFLLFRIRKAQKAIQAFLEPLSKPRVHSTPNVTGTLGTRFSYSKPNPQQWNKAQKSVRYTTGEKFDLAPNIRKLVKAPDGYCIIEFDYSALELMGVSYRTNNQMWLEWIRNGDDMHVRHVGLMYGVWLHRKSCTEHGCDGGEHYCTGAADHNGKELGWIDPNGLRQITKGTTYARFYNANGNPDPVVKLMAPKMPSITKEDVEEAFSRMDTAVPHIANWHQEMHVTDRRLGHVETGLGGWRLLAGTRPDDNRDRSFEIQSTMGDYVATAMLNLRPLLDTSRGQRMLFQVHDAFVVQCKLEDRVEVARKMVKAMCWVIPELWGFKNISFPVDGGYGPNWADQTKFTHEELFGSNMEPPIAA